MDIVTAKGIRLKLLVVALALAALIGGCTQGPPVKGGNSKSASGRIRIGLSMDTLKEERWQKDRDLFTARAKELGADVLVQSADGDDKVQTQQAENWLTQGVDALVVIPPNAE